MDLFNPQKKIQQQVNQPSGISPNKANSTINQPANMDPQTPQAPKSKGDSGLSGYVQQKLNGSKPPQAGKGTEDLPSPQRPPTPAASTPRPETPSPKMPKPNWGRPSLPRFKKP